jgi:hypothetical protein
MDSPATVTLEVRFEMKFGLYYINWIVYQAKVYFYRYVNKHGSGNWKEVRGTTATWSVRKLFMAHVNCDSNDGDFKGFCDQ